jgi:hypothetical protein
MLHGIAYALHWKWQPMWDEAYWERRNKARAIVCEDADLDSRLSWDAFQVAVDFADSVLSDLDNIPVTFVKG